MTYTEAQTEFSIRLYQWAKGALAREIEASIPSFKLCKDGPLKPCSYFATLNPIQRAAFAEMLLHQRHQAAVETLGETLSEPAQAMIGYYDKFLAYERPGFGNRVLALETSDSPPQFVRRPQLKKAMEAHFQSAFGSECLPKDPLLPKSELIFAMKCRGWTIKTLFDFGRWYPQICHAHTIWTGKWITADQPALLPANALALRLSYGLELGVGNGWEFLTDADVEPTCAAVVEHCRRMFDVLSEILEGLDLEILTT